MKKIDEKTLEKIQLLCYKVLLFGVIDSQSMAEAKNIAARYLHENDFEIHEVKCDLENNTPESIDISNINIDIYEIVIHGSLEYRKHRIIL